MRNVKRETALESFPLVSIVLISSILKNKPFENLLKDAIWETVYARVSPTKFSYFSSHYQDVKMSAKTLIMVKKKFHIPLKKHPYPCIPSRISVYKI